MMWEQSVRRKAAGRMTEFLGRLLDARDNAVNNWLRHHPYLVLYVAGLLGIVGAGTVAFRQIGGAAFFSWDSASQIAFANEALRDGLPLTLGPSFSQSLGNIGYPIDYWLLPESLLSSRGGAIDPVLFYLTAALLFFTCAFAMGALFRCGPWLSVAAASAFSLLTLPYSAPVVLTEVFWWHAPFMIPTVYMTFALLASFYLIGRLKAWPNVLSVAAFVLAVFWVAVGYPKYSAVIFVGAAVFCLIFVLGAEKFREAFWKLGAGALAGAAFLASGCWTYLKSVYGYTANFIFNPTLETGGGIDIQGVLRALFLDPSTWISSIGPNLVWVKYYTGYWLAGGALFGAVWALASPLWPRPVKLLAAGVLTIFPFSFITIYASIHPTQVYYLLFLMAFLPLADLGARLRFRAMKRVEGAAGRRSGWLYAYLRAPLIGPAAVAAVVFATGLALPGPVRPAGYPYPPAADGLAALLKREIRFAQGDTFRGRYVNLLLTQPIDRGKLPPASNSTAMALAMVGLDLAATQKNDLTYAGLRYHDVPVTVEYNRMNTPLSVMFHNFLLVRDGDPERLDYRTITRFDPRLLGLIGVRYVLSADSPGPAGARVAVADPLPERPDVALYEIIQTNTGQYSPVKLQLIANFGDALVRLADAGFDPRQTALVHEEVPAGSLVAAEAVTVRRIRNGLQVSARSRGMSYVVLPFEFSRCFQIEATKGAAPILVNRTNLILTGVLFEREAQFNLRFSFGPFGNPACRLQDLQDTRNLDLSYDRVKALHEGYKTRLLFGGLY
jgi:hypothetical protein